MKLIKEGIAKDIPAHLVAEYKAKGWREIVQPAKEVEPEQKQEKPKSRSKKEA